MEGTNLEGPADEAELNIDDVNIELNDEN